MRSLIAVSALLSAVGTAGAQPLACDFFELNRTEARFVRLKELRRADPGAVTETEFRDAARAHVRVAQACYAERYGADAGEPVYIDDGAVLMEDVPAFNTANGRKWGAGSPYFGGQDIPGPGLPGGTVTWSLMPNGVDMSAEPATPNVAVPSLPTFQPCFVSEIENAFDVWSAVADIQFTQVADNGAAFDAPAATSGAIRVGAHTFDGAGGVLAHGYFPPPNGNTAAGDIHFDASENWACSDTGPEFDIGIVAIHELGHAIGLNHETPPPTAIMNPFYSAALDMLQPDDILGAESIYGPSGGCTLDVALSYDGALLRLTFDIGHHLPSKFNTWLVYGNGELLRLWAVDIPPVVPPSNGSTRLAIPPIGTVGVLTSLTTLDGIACADFETLDTTP